MEKIHKFSKVTFVSVVSAFFPKKQFSRTSNTQLYAHFSICSSIYPSLPLSYPPSFPPLFLPFLFPSVPPPVSCVPSCRPTAVEAWPRSSAEFLWIMDMLRKEVGSDSSHRRVRVKSGRRSGEREISAEGTVKPPGASWGFGLYPWDLRCH